MWMLNFYQEMVEKKVHCYFPYDTKSKLVTRRASDKFKKDLLNATEDEKTDLKEEKLENESLAYSYLIRCLDPETVQALEATETVDENGSLWKALLTQCQSEQKHTLREIHQQLINVEMSPSESLVAYQGRVQ